MKKLGTNEYQCGHCGEVYEKGWSDEDAKKEALDNFGKPVDEWKDEAVIICDDCFQEMNPMSHPEAVAEAKKHI